MSFRVQPTHKFAQQFSGGSKADDAKRSDEFLFDGSSSSADKPAPIKKGHSIRNVMSAQPDFF